MGLQRHASAQSINSTYKELLKKHHSNSKLRGAEPDEERFKEAQGAASVVSLHLFRVYNCARLVQCSLLAPFYMRIRRRIVLCSLLAPISRT